MPARGGGHAKATGGRVGAKAIGEFYKKEFNVRDKKENKVPAYIAAMAKTPGYAAGEKATPIAAPKPQTYNPRLPTLPGTGNVTGTAGGNPRLPEIPAGAGNLPSWIGGTNWGAGVPTNPNLRLPALPTGPAIGGTDWSKAIPANAGNPRLPIIPPGINAAGILAAFGVKPPTVTPPPVNNLSGGVPREPGERLGTSDIYALSTYPPRVNYMLPPEAPPVSGGGGYGGGGGHGGGGGGRGNYTPYPPYTPKTYTPTEYEKWLRELLGRWNI